MGYKSPRTYTICGAHTTGYNPVDATAFYGGGSTVSFGTGAASRHILITKSGFIRSIQLSTYSATAAGTNEDWLFSVYDGTTTTTINTVSSATNERVWRNNNLNYPVTEGGYIQLVTTPPAWFTNPEGFTGNWIIIVEYE